MSGKTVLILGAGTGGLVTAHRLRRTLDKEHRVILVDRSPHYSFAPAYTGVMLGRRTPARITRAGPELGEHNAYVLGEILGYDDDRIGEVFASLAMQ